jgi:DNA-binding NtrC family response regulator
LFGTSLQLRLTIVDAALVHGVGYGMQDLGESASVATSSVIGGARAAAMRPVLDLARRAARSSANVLIAGESGAGKRSLARWIHASSARRAGPLVVAGSAAVSEALHAVVRRASTHTLFDDAAGGTLVIDELFDLSHEAQAALVQLLDTPALRPEGASGTRVIATTQHAPRGGRLRADLYYAIAVIAIAVPPLRERTEDIPGLVASFLARSSHGAAAITDAALACLSGAEWPGNVRELETTIERAVALSDDGVIDVAHLAGLACAAGAAVTSRDRRGRRSSHR